ncbi:MAG: hypothetical protein A2Z04_01730 [Chloroflexi bacterium RBG_16_57_9]|nr:MAG: hypothetical protein A2Z04_01730 [Chloroflexi bacterium RBG_16_57_9]
MAVMITLQIPDELVQEIQSEAEIRGLPVEEYLRAVIRRERTLADRRKIEREQAWWFSLPLGERARYEGKYVAVHNLTLVDSDRDERALYRRVRAKYGKTAVLIMPGEGPREIHIRSPRLVRE